jgi:hypothetical protein
VADGGAGMRIAADAKPGEQLDLHFDVLGEAVAAGAGDGFDLSGHPACLNDPHRSG